MVDGSGDVGSGAPRRAPSMADVAAAIGVSHQTVSRVLNGSPLVREDTRERVLAAITEMGYRRNNAARVLATNRSGRIGLISAHLALYGPSMVMDAVHGAAQRAGYEVSTVGLEELSAESLRGAVDRLLDQAVEAMVIAVAHRDALESARSLKLSIPVVLAQGVTEAEPMAAGIDQVAGAELATTHLLDLGHERVAHITGPLDWVETETRRVGWRAAHEARGLEPGPELIGDWSARSGYDAGRVIAADPDITAVFAANDTMALGLLRALHEAGRQVPRRGERGRLRRHPGRRVLLAGPDHGQPGLRRPRPPGGRPHDAGPRRRDHPGRRTRGADPGPPRLHGAPLTARSVRRMLAFTYAS